MKRTLLTGFGPFLSVADNPSQRLVEHFAANGSPGHVLTSHVFPVSWARVAQQLEELLGETGDVLFDNVLMLGVNTGAQTWRIERLGINLNEAGSVDMDGEAASDGPIVSAMPQHLECTLSIDRLVRVLKAADIPAVISNSAGGYLCNHLLFRALARLQTSPNVAAGFIHIPADRTTFAPESNPRNLVYPTFETHVRAIEVVLRELNAP